MRPWWVAWSVVLAGCYAPTTPAGVACDPAIDNCPSGQTCVASGTDYVCAKPGGGEPLEDAGRDAIGSDAMTTSTDLDGDGIANALDNCPSVANANQVNEDGDRFGDACDPCPPIADDNPADSDGDGVANACDPRPMVPGDRIVMFEGFQGGLPPSWFRFGAWTAGAGAAVADVIGNKANLTLPSPGADHETTTASITVNTIAGGIDSAVGVVELWDHTIVRKGVFCHISTWVDAMGALKGTPLALNELKSQGAQVPFEMVAGQTYRVAIRRDGSSLGCGIAKGATTATTASVTSTFGTAEVGVRVIHAKATVNWVMVVAN